MVIEYRIKRFDPVKSYFYNLRHSRRTQLLVFGPASLLFLYILYLRYNVQYRLVLVDFIVAFLYGLGFLLLIPAFSFLTAKTQMRTFAISPEGIETKIGSYQGKILWKNVESIVATQDRIFITGKSANTFTIPSSAFASEELRKQFIDMATQYHQDAKSSN